MFWKPQPLHMSAAQILWIVVDDTPEPDAGLASMLTCSGLPFLYFPYGPTSNWGNAQRNAALMVVRALGRLGMMGPGYFMDDDSYISPWLFEPMFQVSWIHSRVYKSCRWACIAAFARFCMHACVHAHAPSSYVHCVEFSPSRCLSMHACVHAHMHVHDMHTIMHVCV